MPIEEERIRIVEYNLNQFKTETVKVYQDMAFEVTMLKGLAEDSIKRLMGVRATLNEHTALLNEHTTLLNEHSARLDSVDTRLDHIETLLTQILARLPEQPN